MKGDEMIKRKLLTLAVILITMVTPAIGQAENASFELNANDSEVESRLAIQINPYTAPLTIGAGFLYSDDDDFWQVDLNIAIKDEVFTPGLNLGLGFKGIFGEVDSGPRDYDTRAFAFQFLTEYDFRETTANFPVSIIANLGWAPDVLSFSDTEEYFEFYTAAYLHINYWASIYVGYRIIEIDYETSSTEYELEHDSLFIGAKLTF